MQNQFILGLTNSAKEGLVSTFSAVAEDKLTWKPLDNGRSALDLFGEAAQTPALVATIIETRSVNGSAEEIFGRMRAERANWSREDALSAMETNYAEFSRVISGLSDEQLGEILSLSMGRGMTLPIAGWAMMLYRSFVSRFGQINYIQTLYGDFDMH